jgi:hypothetical protein
MKKTSLIALAIAATQFTGWSQDSNTNQTAVANVTNSPASAKETATAPVSAALFNPHAPLATNQAVKVVGLVEYNTPEKDPHISNAYARLEVAGGDFQILLDATGEQMAKAMDGKKAEVRGTLTGNSLDDVIESPSGYQAARVPELKVTDYKAAQ